MYSTFLYSCVTKSDNFVENVLCINNVSYIVDIVRYTFQVEHVTLPRAYDRCVKFQARDLYYVGVYTAMSILQGGNGLPCLDECVYNYLCGGGSTGISVSPDRVPDQTLRFAMEKVGLVATKCSIIHCVWHYL